MNSKIAALPFLALSGEGYRSQGNSSNFFSKAALPRIPKRSPTSIGNTNKYKLVHSTPLLSKTKTFESKGFQFSVKSSSKSTEYEPCPLADSLGAESGWVTAGDGTKLHYVAMGDQDAPLVVFVHGFPEFWYCWRQQLPALAEAGYRAVAMDMRGYNLSDKPKDLESYAIATLAGDVKCVIDELGGGGDRQAKAVVAHDWGGAVAWEFAQRHPESYSSLVVLNCPHPVAFKEELKRSVRQAAKSWYIAAFQIPFIPEAIFEVFDWFLLRRVFARDPEPPYSPETIEKYVDAYKNNSGSMTSAINYYRRNAGPLLNPTIPSEEKENTSTLQVIEKPVLVLWGENDSYLDNSMADPPKEWVLDSQTKFIASATHWVNNDKPEIINSELIQFLHTPEIKPKIDLVKTNISIN